MSPDFLREGNRMVGRIVFSTGLSIVGSRESWRCFEVERVIRKIVLQKVAKEAKRPVSARANFPSKLRFCL